MNDKLIKVGDKTYKEAQVIILPTNEVGKKGDIVINPNVPKGYRLFVATADGHFSKKQHLYIVTSEVIKEGDWVINTSDSSGFPQLEQVSLYYLKSYNLPEYAYIKKIIASTDSSLKLPIPESLAEYPMSYTPKSIPRPSDDFIKKYCELNGEIKDVLVEYKHEIWDVNPDENVYILKVAEDNTISIIKKEEKNKESWREIISKFLDENKSYYDGSSNKVPVYSLDWFEENYYPPTKIDNKQRLYTKEELEAYITLAWACCSATTYKRGDDIGADCRSWINTHIK